MLHLSALALFLTAADPTWHTDYAKATDLAMKEKKDLVIYFRHGQELDEALKQAGVQERLAKFVCLRVPLEYKVGDKRLLDYPVLEDMRGRPGLVVVSYHDRKLPTFATVISAHPVMQSRYHWVPSYGSREIALTLDLPAHMTLSQRSMVYAVRVHPEVPQSVFAIGHPAFLAHAQIHSERQASMLNQHHANLIGASNWISSQMGVGLGNASEVVAESWGSFVGGENVLEAAFSCIDAWRHSPGHWSAVAGRHTYFGYDIAQGRNGTWYATGIFAD